MSTEYEVKLPGTEAALLEALARAGAKPVGPRLLQDDLVLDTRQRRLEAEDQLLRLRRAGGRFLLTFKGRRAEETAVKARQEIETQLDDGEAILEIFERLGFIVALRYQKYRTHYSCAACAQTTLSLDETPIGCFIEVEGDPAHIERCAARLGFDRGSFETRSYLEIHRDLGGAGDMVFETLSEAE